jgi:hypothetical protein
MEERTEFLEDIRHRLEQAQALQKHHYDRLHREVTYQAGDWALFRLRQWPTTSMPQATTGKLKPRFYGPYLVVELINDVAVRLAPPPQVRLHDVLHVGLLKKFHGTPPQEPPTLPPVHHGTIVLSQSGPSSHDWCAACAGFSFSGKGRHQLHHHGRISTCSVPGILNFSSRTSCLSRRGEM